MLGGLEKGPSLPPPRTGIGEGKFAPWENGEWVHGEGEKKVDFE